MASAANLPQVFEIPLKAGVPQLLSVFLAGVEYQLRLTWCDPMAAWVLDIFDASGNPLAQGLAMVTGLDLLSQLEYLGIGGQLVVQVDNDSSAVPNFTQLGDTGHLYFIPG